jgi:tricorn protease-like protein
VNKTHEDGTTTVEKQELAPRFSVEVKNLFYLSTKSLNPDPQQAFLLEN